MDLVDILGNTFDFLLEIPDRVKKCVHEQATHEERNNLIEFNRNLLEWVRTEMKKKATEFDNACKFIISHEDQFREWEEMQRQANIFYNKIQKNFVEELKANGDFQ